MHISNLLLEQVKLYRYQEDWSTRKEPSIRIVGRDRRKASTSMLPAYCMTLAYELQDIAIPRRWKSSFAATSVKDSYYLKYLKIRKHDGTPGRDAGGLREVKLPANTVVAWIEDDFNNRGLNVDTLIWSTCTRLQNFVDVLSGEPAGQRLQETLKNLEDNALSNQGSDERYALFVEAVSDVDQHILNGVDFGLEQGKTLSDTIIDRIMQRESVGMIGVGMLSEIPEGSYEVWFEGDYDAVLPDA